MDNLCACRALSRCSWRRPSRCGRLPWQAANCNLATSQGSTGPADWATFCWLDLAAYNDTTARSAAGQNFSYTLPDGTTMTFKLKVTGPVNTSATAPSWTGAAVGNTAFLGISGKPILYQTGGGTSVVTISNIVLTPPAGGTITSYMFVAADAESSNDNESLKFQTNGGNWSILDQVGPITGNSYPTISGAGTQTFTETGAAGTVGAYIVGSATPTQVTTTMVGGGLQGAMFAVRFASISLNTVITGARAAPADQFAFSINPTGGGSAFASGTTTGTGLGPFTAASLPTSASLALTLSQAMAGGSTNTISHYRSSLTCTNSTVGSSTTMPTNVITTAYNFGTLQFGDKVTCTYTQTPFPHLTLTKALGRGRPAIRRRPVHDGDQPRQHGGGNDHHDGHHDDRHQRLDTAISGRGRHGLHLGRSGRGYRRPDPVHRGDDLHECLHRLLHHAAGGGG